MKTWTNEGNTPVCRFNGNLLIKQYASLFENEMAPLGLVTVGSTKDAYERPLRVREQLIRQLFLRIVTRECQHVKLGRLAISPTLVCHLDCAAGESALRQ